MASPPPPSEQVAVLRLQLAGHALARGADGRAVPLAPLDATLLAWLAIEGPTPRSRLAQLLWPGHAPDAARNSLRQRLFQLKRQFGAALVQGRDTLALGTAVAHDLHDADALLAHTAIDADGELADWLAQQRDHRHRQRRLALAARAAEAEAALDWPAALALALGLATRPVSDGPAPALCAAFAADGLARVIALEPLDEQAIARLVGSLALAQAAGASGNQLLMMNNRARVLRTQGRAAVLEWVEAIDRLHATDAPNPRAWLHSRVGASEALRDAGRYAEALQVLAQQRDRVPVLAGDLAATWDVAELLLWLALGPHARAQQVAQRLAQPVAAVGPGWLRSRVLLARARAAARVAGQGLHDHPLPEALALLAEAGEAAPRDHRRSAWYDVVLQRAEWSDADTGAALAEGLAEQARAQGMVDYARRAWLLAAARALDGGQTTAAQRCAQRADELETFRFDAATGPEPVLATGCSPGWADTVQLRLARAAGHPDAPALASAACQRLPQTARDQVPPEFREAFVERQPESRQLLALCRQMAQG